MDFPGRINLSKHDKLLILVSGAIGLLTPLFSVDFVAFWSLIPLLVLEASSRKTAFLMTFAFYLLSSRDIVSGAYIFFRDGNLFRAILLWVSSAFCLSLPSLLCWPSRASSKITVACKVILMLLLPVIPPLGLIGWGTPLVGAGVFFPEWGWSGLFILILLYVASAMWRSFRLWLMTLMLVSSFFCCAFCPVEVKPASTIQGINLSLGRLASGSGDFDTQYQRGRAVFAELQRRKRNGELKSSIILLPETVTGKLYPTTRKRWRKFLAELDSERVFIVGGEIPKKGKYDNVMVAFNAPGEPTAVQRCPVPFSMYRPFSSTGANAVIFSRGEESILEINGQKIGVLICYEAFLTWPLFSIMTLKPDMIVAPANLWWCRNTSLPKIRDMTLTALAAIFNVPVVSAVNT